MPNRILKESIRKSRTLDRLTWAEEVAFYRLIASADDYGRFHADPVLVRAELFPWRITKIGLARMGTMLDSMERVGLIRRYVVDGQPFLQLVKWDQHQRIRSVRGKYPGPEMESAATRGDLRQIAADGGDSRPNPIQSNPDGIQGQSNTADLAVQKRRQVAHDLRRHIASGETA